ncbi:MAG: DUF2330 domain-containing protein [Deltaproteobacteria bacterium]|nr:DUF2330 domain-containing protein [Deltaproteobacteria bacterium]
MKRLGMLAVVCLGAWALPTDAGACGGCFAPPATVQVVTDHRMVLAVTATQTTLWDQFRYTGRPADFSWILPIRYSPEVRVALADNAFMQAADNLTAPVVIPPTRPRPPFCGAAPPPFAGGAQDAATAADGGVTVHREEVVGPYAVSIIGGRDAMELRNWMRANGYTVPREVEPVIDHYVGLSMDFIALRLRPGEGIDRMSPVRVSWPGNSPTLPLRMIAAGVADKVGLSLVVLAPSRMEAMNFPNGEVREADLTYDFARPNDPAGDFLREFERLNRLASQRLWLTESATRQSDSLWMSAVRSVPGPGGPGGPGRDAGMVTTPPDSGVMTSTDPLDDVRVAFGGAGSVVVTRMRADLPAAMLDRDLLLQASDRSTRERQYNYGRTVNVPTFPPCPPDGGVVPFPQPDAGTGVDGGLPPPIDRTADAGPPPIANPEASGGLRCNTRPGAPSYGWLALGALGLLARRRRRAA